MTKLKMSVNEILRKCLPFIFLMALSIRVVMPVSSADTAPAFPGDANNPGTAVVSALPLVNPSSSGAILQSNTTTSPQQNNMENSKPLPPPPPNNSPTSAATSIFAGCSKKVVGTMSKSYKWGNLDVTENWTGYRDSKTKVWLYAFAGTITMTSNRSYTTAADPASSEESIDKYARSGTEEKTLVWKYQPGKDGTAEQFYGSEETKITENYDKTGKLAYTSTAKTESFTKEQRETTTFDSEKRLIDHKICEEGVTTCIEQPLEKIHNHTTKEKGLITEEVSNQENHRKDYHAEKREKTTITGDKKEYTFYWSINKSGGGIIDIEIIDANHTAIKGQFVKGETITRKHKEKNEIYKVGEGRGSVMFAATHFEDFTEVVNVVTGLRETTTSELQKGQVGTDYAGVNLWESSSIKSDNLFDVAPEKYDEKITDYVLLPEGNGNIFVGQKNYEIEKWNIVTRSRNVFINDRWELRTSYQVGEDRSDTRVTLYKNGEIISQTVS